MATMRRPLTPAQKRVFDFIRAEVARTGMAPSFDEIATGLGLKSLATVHNHVENLSAKGYIERTPGQARSMRVIESDIEAKLDSLARLHAWMVTRSMRCMVEVGEIYRILAGNHVG